MSKIHDVECPYCGAGQSVHTDHGAVYSESERHEMQCRECEKNFVFTTHIHFLHSPYKADCLNGEPHDLKLSKTFPPQFARMCCQNCDYEESPKP
jgi:hypothetical protein